MAPMRIVRKSVDWLERYDKWVYLALLALSVLTLALMFYTLYDSGQKYKRVAIENKRLATENQQRIADIQNERINNIYNSCKETNSRHLDAEEKIDLIYKGAFDRASTQAERTRLEASKASTLSLINALVPLRKNCYTFALTQVPSSKGETDGQ